MHSTVPSTIRSRWQNDKQIIVFGNGGSALTAQHYVTDWNKAIYLKTGRPFRGVCLAENMGLITAYANDIAEFTNVFEQLKTVQQRRSGYRDFGQWQFCKRSAVNPFAPRQWWINVGICGYDGGKLSR